ncbi:zinc-binding protein A33-like [Protopterus annectens]|uniref:zinc-binding protein A33-like n=1 Tax=Protopterus annectens TaxID=7888 RepID=UPI001CFA123B|nr:zinc-binding protein A33-like [Protopterus annectens]
MMNEMPADMVGRFEHVKLKHLKQEKEYREIAEMQNLRAANGGTKQCCGEHRRRLELFCQEDEAFVCVLCVPGHSSHSFMFLHEAVSVYKDKLKVALTSLESKVKDFKHLQNNMEKNILDTQEEAFTLEEFIKHEFAKLHNFLQDKEQKLIQQLRDDEVNILKDMTESLDCVKHELELKNEETEVLEWMNEKSEFIKNDIATQKTFESNLNLIQQEPPCLLTVPETFEDVAVTFSEDEWQMLRKEDKDLYREVMVQNYETLVSVVKYHSA